MIISLLSPPFTGATLECPLSHPTVPEHKSLVAVVPLTSTAANILIHFSLQSQG